MKNLFRLIKILHKLGKYRLIELLPDSLPAYLWLFLFPLLMYPKSKKARGERLRLTLEELGPIFIKFGQLLSTRPDLIPEDIVAELALLQDKVPPFDSNAFIAIAEEALGQNIDEVFSDFEPKALASASIAQVHCATLKTGEDVVIKVVRPKIENVIDQDTKLLAFLARWLEKLLKTGKRLRPVEVVRDYRETIFDELDLTKEAANASQLRRNFENSKKLYIPKVYWDYSRRNILVMERIYGIPVNNIAEIKAQKTDLKLLAERGVEIFFKQVFEHNFFHADMHPGNVFVSRANPTSPSYIAVDMAIIGSLSKEDQYYLARNLIAMFRRDYRQVAELHVLSGWVPEHTSINQFESAIRSVCEPIFQKPLKDISFGEALITLFQTAQRFEMPVQPQLVLLQKTLLNIEGLGRQMYPELDLWETAHPYLERWIRDRYHPKTLWQDLKYHSTDWLEKFPEVPGLVFETMQEIKTLAQIAPELKRASESIQTKNNRRNYLFSILLAIAAVSSYFLFNETITIEKSVLAGLLGFAALALAWKK